MQRYCCSRHVCRISVRLPSYFDCAHASSSPEAMNSELLPVRNTSSQRSLFLSTPMQKRISTRDRQFLPPIRQIRITGHGQILSREKSKTISSESPSWHDTRRAVPDLRNNDRGRNYYSGIFSPYHLFLFPRQFIHANYLLDCYLFRVIFIFSIRTWCTARARPSRS